MKSPLPSFRRFSFGAKNSSLARSVLPPTRSEARSMRPEKAAAVGSMELVGFSQNDRARGGSDKPVTLEYETAAKVRSPDSSGQKFPLVGGKLMAVVDHGGVDRECG